MKAKFKLVVLALFVAVLVFGTNRIKIFIDNIVMFFAIQTNIHPFFIESFIVLISIIFTIRFIWKQYNKPTIPKIK